MAHTHMHPRTKTSMTYKHEASASCNTHMYTIHQQQYSTVVYHTVAMCVMCVLPHVLYDVVSDVPQHHYHTCTHSTTA